MPGLLIIAHAPLASSLKAVAEHAFPDCAGQLAALDVPGNMPIEEIEAQGRIMLEQIRSPEALILTDVFGATPCNVAQKLLDGPTVRLLAGVNVPMLWRSLCYASESIEDMAERAADGAMKGVMQVASSRPQNQTLKHGSHDPENNQDQ